MERKTRQNLLYKYLLNQYDRQVYISKEEICEALPIAYSRETERTSEHNSNAFAKIRRDVASINDSGREKIVVSNKYGYKIGNNSESTEYVNKRIEGTKKAMFRYYELRKKIQNDGQMKAITNGVIKETETYVKE